MKKIVYKVTYSDGDYEYWTDVPKEEVERLEKLNGDKLISQVECEIGGQLIDRHTHQWNQIWNELTIPVSKSEGFRYMTGGYNNNLVS